MDKKELIDFLEEFRTGLISKATDGTIDEAVYSASRDKLINIKEIKDYIPTFIKAQRSAELFRKYMQRHEHYKERREEINEAFDKMMNYVEFDMPEEDTLLKGVSKIVVDNDYIRSLEERVESDLKNENYDSVITKSRTLIEETLIQILEDNDKENESKGNINKLYNQVKTLFNMRQSNELNKNINELLGGLEKIISSVAEMRNLNSDAHGVGNKRVNIRKCEANLIVESSIVFCKYLLRINEIHKSIKNNIKLE